MKATLEPTSNVTRINVHRYGELFLLRGIERSDAALVSGKTLMKLQTESTRITGGGNVGMVTTWKMVEYTGSPKFK